MFPTVVESEWIGGTDIADKDGGQKVDQRISTNELNNKTILKLCMLGCEPNPPYGPNEHTAQMLIELLQQAIEQKYIISNNANDAAINNNNGKSDTSRTKNSFKIPKQKISIDVYDVQKFQYPSDDSWNDNSIQQQQQKYDGIIIPGSFASAYSTDEWIIQLKQYIQNTIHSKQIKTLAICFGHQVFAHSFFPYGVACKTPTGSRAGRFPIHLKQEHQQPSSNENNIEIGTSVIEPINQNDIEEIIPTTQLDIFASHSDMVQKLPPSALCLGGYAEIPIHVAAYFENERCAKESLNDNTRTGTCKAKTLEDAFTFVHSPYAITLQGHPEFSTSLGYKTSFPDCIDSMCARKLLTPDYVQNTKQDNEKTHEKVRNDSINLIIMAGSVLGWFP